MFYLGKFSGQGAKPPPSPALRQIAFVWVGGLLAAAAIGALTYHLSQPLMLGSFGASIFVLFILPDTPFAQPRNVIGGHFVASLVGLVFFHLVSTEWWSMALALATSLAAMQILRVPHPPAGSNPFIVFLTAPYWDFLWMPTLLGATVLVLVALLYNNLASDRHYPKYWF